MCFSFIIPHVQEALSPALLKDGVNKEINTLIDHCLSIALCTYHRSVQNMYTHGIVHTSFVKSPFKASPLTWQADVLGFVTLANLFALSLLFCSFVPPLGDVLVPSMFTKLLQCYLVVTNNRFANYVASLLENLI